MSGGERGQLRFPDPMAEGKGVQQDERGIRSYARFGEVEFHPMSLHGI